jgi:hypothetical protein
MEEMGLKNISTHLKNTDIKKRELIINKFIEKFPKAKLHTLTQVNKYYNKKNIELDENQDVIIGNNLIYNSLLVSN